MDDPLYLLDCWCWAGVLVGDQSLPSPDRVGEKTCWHPVFGFDVIRFCESLEVAGTESCRDRVAEVYGQKGVEWIKCLIGLGMELLDEEAALTNK